jgi:hypothetical protein
MGNVIDLHRKRNQKDNDEFDLSTQKLGNLMTNFTLGYDQILKEKSNNEIGEFSWWIITKQDFGEILPEIEKGDQVVVLVIKNQKQGIKWE